MSAVDAAEADLRQLGPMSVRATTRRGATHQIFHAVAQRAPLRVAFANTHLLYCALKEPAFAEDLRSFYIVNDGIGVTLLARLLCGAGFSENLNGTDLTPAVLAALPFGTRVFLVGAKREVVDVAAQRIARRWPHLFLCGWRDGYTGKEAAVEEIAQARPDLVLVAMGNPLQERWITQASAHAPDAVFVGVGALFDFLAGATPRAPRAWQDLHLEWAFRLMLEPQRLWRRYTVEIVVVLASLLRRRWSH